MSNAATAQTVSYASKVNAQYSDGASHIVSPKQRWDNTYNRAPKHIQNLYDTMLDEAIFEFRRRNPHLKQWSDLDLADARPVKLSTIKIDGSMQRLLDIEWVINILYRFSPTMVVPIQVYQPDPAKDEYLAWDGQHTLMLMWLIATQVFEVDPDEVTVPTNLYKSNLKSEMRANFISLNSREGKKNLEAIDIATQQIFGVRIDGSKNPEWMKTEQKQQHVEQHDLFLTAKKFGDEDQAGAISRLQEFNKLEPESIKWLCRYLSLVATGRPAEEKEMVMMAQFFDRCRVAGVNVDDQYVTKLAAVAKRLWNADFSPNGKFWTRAGRAYYNWHESINPNGKAKFNKEPPHGMPFLLAQLEKSFDGEIPENRSSSEFEPFAEDLF